MSNSDLQEIQTCQATRNDQEVPISALVAYGDAMPTAGDLVGQIKEALGNSGVLYGGDTGGIASTLDASMVDNVSVRSIIDKGEITMNA